MIRLPAALALAREGPRGFGLRARARPLAGSSRFSPGGASSRRLSRALALFFSDAPRSGAQSVKARSLRRARRLAPQAPRELGSPAPAASRGGSRAGAAAASSQGRSGRGAGRRPLLAAAGRARATPLLAPSELARGEGPARRPRAPGAALPRAKREARLAPRCGLAAHAQARLEEACESASEARAAQEPRPPGRRLARAGGWLPGWARGRPGCPPLPRGPARSAREASAFSRSAPPLQERRAPRLEARGPPPLAGRAPAAQPAPGAAAAPRRRPRLLQRKVESE